DYYCQSYDSSSLLF
nr:immunoglobulin light chain junction region [Macaca mulatta]MOW36514.1 immunoglobulin light chain junction region [Macaca mulatta]MOW36641.1 immunoglobulin light chain junction region [Macaca mulatta]MOW36882.1 immunoglobulin light chain junction region [Macaca mulatta]MOW37048.1 immunoglobulin light chain junction region [Macaca mulatta]